jgi:hypothetical protein
MYRGTYKKQKHANRKTSIVAQCHVCVCVRGDE